VRGGWRSCVVVAFALAVTVTACGGNGTRSQTAGAAGRFLDRYVARDGRVLRHDQGGDIVSEGQAYAMLLSEAAGRPERTRTIWAWTSAHLLRPDGLVAWHADRSGRVEDPQPAADADVLIAYALLRYAGPGAAALHREGRRVAAAILANESVTLPGGAPLLVAGPWAKAASPPVVNPSYLMPGVFEALGRFTGDSRWTKAAALAVAAIRGVTAAGRRLPPDWAILSGRRLIPVPAPAGQPGVQYGEDAARLAIWFATACDPGARSLAARWWRILAPSDRSGSAALGLTGRVVDAARSPLNLVAGAAAAAAAGDGRAARRLRDRAAALATRIPTYYGDAWTALGPALLDGSIDPCGESAGAVS
jgi:endoglucanase